MIGFNHLGKMGQLGNQMFQYAATKGISKKIGTDFIIPDHREVVVDSLGNKLRIELFNAFKLDPSNRGYLNVSGDNYAQETTFEFDEFFFNLDPKDDYSLLGFFQTEKYFKHIESEIREDFTFQDQYVNECADIVEQFDNPIALHIRRGDFLINSANHANLPIGYYEAALGEFSDNRQVIVFSDDAKWCKEQPLFSDDRFLVSEGNGPYHDLYLMTKCSDFVLANSTFSWWGAWLANTEKVVAPSLWFGPNNADKSTKDLYLEDWVIL
jgi:hypothetical protein